MRCITIQCCALCYGETPATVPDIIDETVVDEAPFPVPQVGGQCGQRHLLTREGGALRSVKECAMPTVKTGTVAK